MIEQGENNDNEGNETTQNNMNNSSNVLNNNKNNQLLSSKNVTPSKISKKNTGNNIKSPSLTLSPKNDIKSDIKSDIIIKRPKKLFKKERYFTNVIQNYIVKHDFKKLIQLSLQIKIIITNIFGTIFN